MNDDPILAAPARLEDGAIAAEMVIREDRTKLSTDLMLTALHDDGAAEFGHATP